MSGSILISKPASFFESALSAFKRVRLDSEIIERDFIIGGYHLKLEFGGSALPDFITPALEHLNYDGRSRPDLTICLWDSVSTGVEMPSPPWSESDYLARGVIKGFNTERFHTSFHAGSGILSLVDFQENKAIFWTRDSAAIPYYETGAPLRAILQAWLSKNNRQLTHAAAVGTDEGAVLLVGKGGSGKSTTAVTCLQSPLKYVSDDYCLVSTSGPPRVFSLYNTAKLDRNSLARFPELKASVRNYEKLVSEKALLFIQDIYSDKIRKELPLKAILLPRVTGTPTTIIRSASASESLAGLAPSTIFQLPGAGKETFHLMAKLAKQLPAKRLELGTNISEIPQMIANVLAEFWLNEV